MTATVLGEKIRVFIDAGNGTVTEISGAVKSVTCSYGMRNIPTTTIGFADYFPTQFVMEGTIEIDGLIEDAESIPVEKQGEEWMCGYCGTPNEKKARKCNSCGASRMFTY